MFFLHKLGRHGFFEMAFETIQLGHIWKLENNLLLCFNQSSELLAAHTHPLLPHHLTPLDRPRTLCRLTTTLTSTSTWSLSWCIKGRVAVPYQFQSIMINLIWKMNCFTLSCQVTIHSPFKLVDSQSTDFWHEFANSNNVPTLSSDSSWKSSNLTCSLCKELRTWASSLLVTIPVSTVSRSDVGMTRVSDWT